MSNWTPFQKIVIGIHFGLTFVALVHILIGLCTNAWVREVDANDSWYFELLTNMPQASYINNLESLYNRLGIWGYTEFGNEFQSFPIRDYELVVGSVCLILSVFCGVGVYAVFTFQLLMETAQVSARLALMMAYLWFSFLCFFFSLIGTSVCLWYMRQNFEFQRYGYSHNVAWVGFGLSFFAFIVGLLRFMMEKKTAGKAVVKKPTQMNTFRLQQQRYIDTTRS